MSSGRSDSESISECELETTSESDKEFIRGCYNNEPKYSREETDKMKKSVSEKEGSKEGDDTRLCNTTWCTCKNCKFYENMNTEWCRCCQEDAPLLGGKLENIECAMQNADFAILCLSKPVLETACIRTRRYNKKFRDISVFTNK